MKDRTVIATSTIAQPKDRKLKDSSFLVTINPNKSYYDRTTESYTLMERRLKALGNYLLSKKNLMKFVDFIDKGDVELPRSEHVALVEEIGNDRTASVEYNSQYRLHLHVYVSFKHRTFMKLNRDRILTMASAITHIPAKEMHCNISVQGAQFRNYVLKHAG